MKSRLIRHEKVKSFSVLVTFTSFQSKNIDPYVRLIIIMIFPIFITLMVNIWSPLFQFLTKTRRHLQTALRQLVNSSIAQTSLIRLAANSCCCRRAPLSHIRSPLSLVLPMVIDHSSSLWYIQVHCLGIKPRLLTTIRLTAALQLPLSYARLLGLLLPLLLLHYLCAQQAAAVWTGCSHCF